MIPLALVASTLSAQQIVIPDHHHLCESTNQLGSSGTTNFWNTGGGRFQVLYEARHFTDKAGVGGSIWIDELRFRGEDGEPNLGTQFWTGVSVQLGVTTLTATSLTNNFATNQAPGGPPGGTATINACTNGFV